MNKLHVSTYKPINYSPQENKFTIITYKNKYDSVTFQT